MDSARRIPGRLAGFATVATWLIAVPALAAGPAADAGQTRLYGGVLAADCSNVLLPKLRHLGDALDVQDGGKTVLVGRRPRLASDYFVATPPPGFEAAVTSTTAGGEALVFVFYRTPAGLFATVEGGPAVMAALPASLRGKRLRHCDPNRNLAPGASPPVELAPTDLLKDARFRQAWQKAIGSLARERWLVQLDGPAPPVRTVQVDGRSWRLLAACKPHDCGDNNVVLLYDANGPTVFGHGLRRRETLRLGAPPPAIAAELARLWKVEWRAGK